VHVFSAGLEQEGASASGVCTQHWMVEAPGQWLRVKEPFGQPWVVLRQCDFWWGGEHFFGMQHWTFSVFDVFLFLMCQLDVLPEVTCDGTSIRACIPTSRAVLVRGCYPFAYGC
jgi:hypothetical protein